MGCQPHVTVAGKKHSYATRSMKSYNACILIRQPVWTGQGAALDGHCPDDRFQFRAALGAEHFRSLLERPYHSCLITAMDFSANGVPCYIFDTFSFFKQSTPPATVCILPQHMIGPSSIVYLLLSSYGPVFPKGHLSIGPSVEVLKLELFMKLLQLATEYLL